MDPDFAVVYTAAYDYSAAPDTYGAVGDLGAPMHLYEFAYPLSLNHTVALSKLKVVYTGPSEYVNSELAIFAATATPYTPPTPYTVTVNQTTGGTVSVSPTQAVYYSSNTATVTAAAATSYAFVGWNVAGGLISPSASQATLTVLGNVTLSASFAPLSYTGTEQASGGAITVSSPGPYYYGTQISVTASANPGYLFTGWTSSGCSLSNSAVTSTTLTVLGNWTLTAHFTSETFTVALATSTTRVYQNTPVTTKDRHVVALTVSATDTWGNTTYTATLTQTGPGMVTPTQTWTSGTLVPPTGNAPVVWTSPATPTGLSGWLVGGRVSGTVTGAANLGVLTGSCTVTVTVIGNQSGLSNPAAATVMITVRPLGDINNNGQVDNMDLAILNARLNAFAIAPQTDTDCDLSGDGSVTAADRVRLNLILNGVPVP